jgi:hypothetical protein
MRGQYQNGSEEVEEFIMSDTELRGVKVVKQTEMQTTKPLGPQSEFLCGRNN